MTEVTIVPVQSLDELYCQYPRQNEIQPCYLSLDGETGVLSWGTIPKSEAG